MNNQSRALIKGVGFTSPYKDWEQVFSYDSGLKANDKDQVQIGYLRVENPWEFIFKKNYRIFRQHEDISGTGKSDPQWEMVKTIGNLVNIGFYYTIMTIMAVFHKVDQILAKSEKLEKDLEKVDFEKVYKILRILGRKAGVDIDNPEEILPTREDEV